MRERDGDLGVQIGAIPLKARIVRNPDVDVEIPRASASRHPLASPGQPQGGAILDPLGHTDLQTLLDNPQAGPFARGARLARDRALAAAQRTGGRDPEEALCVHDLATTTTLRTGLARCALLRARSSAILADNPPLHLHFLGRAGRHLGQGQLNLRLDVSPPPGAMTHASGKSAAKHVAEDVREGREDVAHIAKTATKTATAWPLVTVAIVERTLFGVRQHLVGLGRLFEARLGLIVAGVPVGM